MTRSTWRRIITDLKNREHIDAYSIAFVAFALAIMALIPDIIPDALKWAAVLAGVGVLVLQITVPDTRAGSVDEFLEDRFSFDKKPFAERLEDASEIWIFAPTGVNLLSAHNCELIRGKVLSKPGGVLRVAILNPAKTQMIELAARQLCDFLDYPIQDFHDSLLTAKRQLEAMSSWQISGSFDYRFLDYNPGFSIVAINPNAHTGRIIVEFHGFHNQAIASRMHIELSRQQSDRWYLYWAEQFESMWGAAEPPAAGRGSGAGTGRGPVAAPDPE